MNYTRSHRILQILYKEQTLCILWEFQTFHQHFGINYWTEQSLSSPITKIVLTLPRAGFKFYSIPIKLTAPHSRSLIQSSNIPRKQEETWSGRFRGWQCRLFRQASLWSCWQCETAPRCVRDVCGLSPWWYRHRLLLTSNTFTTGKGKASFLKTPADDEDFGANIFIFWFCCCQACVKAERNITTFSSY